MTVLQPIIDSHIHFWDTGVRPYSWLANVPKISGPALPELLDAQSQGVDLQGIVFVQAGARDEDGLDEAKWVSDLAEQEPRIRGIVAFAPLELGSAAKPYLDALSELPLVKGIRRIIQAETLDYCAQPAFIEGVQLLSEYGFVFDICIRQEQMPYTIELVDACPNVRFILDHFGKPLVRDGNLDPWREQLCKLAEYPNVWCKISGLATEADHEQWTREQLRPYIDYALTTFGPHRVVYGGDWPVSTLAIGYQEWIDTINWATARMSDEDRNQLFVQNASEFYLLDS